MKFRHEVFKFLMLTIPCADFQTKTSRSVDFALHQVRDRIEWLDFPKFLTTISCLSATLLQVSIKKEFAVKQSNQIVACLFFLIQTCNAHAQTSIDEQVRRLPPGANTLSIVRLHNILESARASEGQWKAALESRFLSGAGAIPPHVDNLVVGSLVHLSVPEEVWSASLVPLDQGMSLDQIAKNHGANVETLAGRDTIELGQNAFISSITPELAAIYSPAQRQDASRWFNQVAAGTDGNITQYLTAAAKNPAHLVMAIDLANMLDPEILRRHLTEDSRFKKYAQLADQLVPLIASLQGVTLAIQVDDQIAANVSIDFGRDVGTSAFSIKSIFLALLDDLGASIEEFTTAKVTADGSTVNMTCDLSDASFRQIVSLIMLPPKPGTVPQSAPNTTKVAEPPKPAPPNDPDKATKDYIAAVNKMIDDLQRANRRATDYNRTILWHQKYADKIEALDRTDVSSEVLDYGQIIASAFRALAASLSGQAVEVNAQQQALVYNQHFDPGWSYSDIWGNGGGRRPSVNVTSNLEEVRRNQAAAVTAGTKDRDAIWLMILDERAKFQRATN